MPPSNNNNNSNMNENEMTYFLVKQVQEQIQLQLKEVIENSKKTSEQVQEIRIEITKLNNIKSDFDNLRRKVEELENYKRNMEQIFTIEDLKNIKNETNAMKKFQVQAITIASAIFFLLQMIAPYVLKTLGAIGN